MTGADILQRAVEILSRGPLTEPDRNHGPFCPWCACADAKSQLEDEEELNVALSLMGFYDWPLVEARMALTRWNGVDVLALDQAAAIDILVQAQQELHDVRKKVDDLPGLHR